MNVEEIYNELVINHYKKPYHRFKPSSFSVKSGTANVSCGDEVSVYLSIDDSGIIEQAAFTSKGCILCRSSASVLVRYVERKSLGAVQKTGEQLIENINKNETEELRTENSDLEENERNVRALAFVKNFPTRKQCVLLPWYALLKAIQEYRNSE